MIYGAKAGLLETYAPQLIDLGGGLVAAAFPLMKIYPAAFCIRRAMQEGKITLDSHIIESSSGTMALGLAAVCNWYGLRLTIVTDPACDDALRRRLEQLGARVEIVPAAAPEGGFQRARLDRLAEIDRSEPDTWWVNQYDNPSNPEAYSKLAADLVTELGDVDCLVGAVGSGGSVCGTAHYLRMLFPKMVVIGVDTFRSILFGQPDGPRALRGLGNSLLPANLDHTVFDEVHWVSAAEAFAATRNLYRETTLFRGGTSGACWMVARYWAARRPQARVVCLFPDDGQRYLNTIYDQEYLQTHRLWVDEPPPAPQRIMHPRDSTSTWSYMEWGRHTYRQIMGPDPRGAGAIGLEHTDLH